MKKPVLFFMAVLLCGLLTACGVGCTEEEEDETARFKEEDLYTVNAYVEEMTPALLEVVPDLKGWKREPHEEDDKPFEYDEERKKWLEEHRESIEEVKKEHLDEDFPGMETIESWEVVVVRGDKEWLMEGDEVVEALEQLNQFTGEVTGTIEMIIANSGELDEEQSEAVLEVIEQVEPTVKEVRQAVFRE